MAEPAETEQEAARDGLPLPALRYSTVRAEWLYRGERRLDGSFYSAEVTAALESIAASGLEVETVGDHAEEVFYPGRFKRIWAHPTRGVPFFGGTEILHLLPQTDKYLSRTQTTDLDGLLVRESWLLITRSGSVGRIAVAGQRLAGAAVSEHVIRLVPSAMVRAGYLGEIGETVD